LPLRQEQDGKLGAGGDVELRLNSAKLIADGLNLGSQTQGDLLVGGVLESRREIAAVRRARESANRWICAAMVS
jgi:hypothetical protein